MKIFKIVTLKYFNIVVIIIKCYNILNYQHIKCVFWVHNKERCWKILFVQRGQNKLPKSRMNSMLNAGAVNNSNTYLHRLGTQTRQLWVLNELTRTFTFYGPKASDVIKSRCYGPPECRRMHFLCAPLSKLESHELIGLLWRSIAHAVFSTE